MRVLVTGANGFVGQHLVHELAENGHEVHATGQDSSWQGRTGVVARYSQADLTKWWPDLNQVDAVAHLAALAAVGPSFEDPQRYLETSSRMVTGLGERLLRLHEQPRVLLISSGAVYDARQPLPIAETGRLASLSPYVVSKLLAEQQASYYLNRGQNWIVARPFNHVGPGQSPGFLVPDLSRAVDEAIRTQSDLLTGNLTTRRDYCDVRDVARAYRLLLEAEGLSVRTYNVCSGRSVSGSEVLANILTARGIGSVRNRVDPGRIRVTDVDDIRGDPTLLCRDTGWRPDLPLQTAIRDFIGTSS